MPSNKEVLFVARPKVDITDDCFKIVDKEVPMLTQDGEVCEGSRSAKEEREEDRRVVRGV